MMRIVVAKISFLDFDNSKAINTIEDALKDIEKVIIKNKPDYFAQDVQKHLGK